MNRVRTPAICLKVSFLNRSCEQIEIKMENSGNHNNVGIDALATRMRRKYPGLYKSLGGKNVVRIIRDIILYRENNDARTQNQHT